MRIVENSHATYQKLYNFYERKLRIAKKYAGSMDKYMSKAKVMMSKADAMISEPDANKEKGTAIGLSLKAALFTVIARYWKHRIHRCANKVENLATRHLDFWTGTGGVYHKQIMMLDHDYAAKSERKKREAREQDKHCTHYGGDGYDTSFFPY